MVYINKKIVEMYEARGWTLYQLAEKSDIPYSTLNSSINRDTPLKIDAIERICKAFGISLSQFFMNDEEYEILDKKEKELIALFRTLSPEKQTALLNLIKK